MGFDNATVKSSRIVATVYVCLFNHFVFLTSVVSCYWNKNIPADTLRWAWETLHAPNWNVFFSSLRSDSPRGNTEGEETHEWDLLAWWRLSHCQRFQLFKVWLSCTTGLPLTLWKTKNVSTALVCCCREELKLAPVSNKSNGAHIWRWCLPGGGVNRT